MTAFTVRSEDLTATVLRAARFVPETLKGWMPAVCKGVLLTAAGDGTVDVLATDLETTGRGGVPAHVAAPGRVLVGGVHLARIVRHLPAADTAITVEGMHAVITSGTATWRLLTMPDDDFPTDLPDGPALDQVKPIAMDGHQLELQRGEAFARRIRPRRSVRPPRVKDLYAPTELDVGAWITWTRVTGDGEESVRGQVWSPAPGTHAVWALVEGERAPVKVGPRYHRRGARVDLADLVEVDDPAPSAAQPHAA
ncbi:hypothetical protein [Actinomadura luteofluorescens]|uniref:hypothetical protein n=1 Tax=Actinomadura luteofluorescens TaxID=46163 RepID=UPI003D949E9D